MLLFTALASPAAGQAGPSHDGAYHGLGRWNAEIMRLSGVSRFLATAKVAERRGEAAATEL